MDQAARDAAGRAVREQMARRQLSPADVIRASGVDNKTLQALLEGTRWPQVKTRARVERAIGWQPGDIERAARGELAGVTKTVTPAHRLTDAELIAELARRLGEASIGRDERKGGSGGDTAPIEDWRDYDLAADRGPKQPAYDDQTENNS